MVPSPNHQFEIFSKSYDLFGEMKRIRHLDISPISKFFRIKKIKLQYQFLTHYFGHAPDWRVKLRKMLGDRTLPDFAILGPIKGASSDLAAHVFSHPCVMIPLAKEMYSANSFPLDTKAWSPFYPTVRQRKETERRFGKALSGFFPPYLHSYRVFKALAEINPKMKIIITLRNPVDRMYSHWKWDVLFAGKDLKEKLPYLQEYSAYVELALDLFPDYKMDTVCGADPLPIGMYKKPVELYLGSFGREDVLILEMTDYFNDRKKTLEKIFTFLDLPIKEVQQFDRRINENPIKLPPADAESRQKLQEFYGPYNRDLFSLIGEEFNW